MEDHSGEDATDNPIPNKIRCPAPVSVDSRVCGRAERVSVEEKGDGWWQVFTRFTLRLRATRSPASWVTRLPA